MNILIIGNGFDLAHKLPTTYKNFLNFIEQVIRMKSFSGTFYAFEYEDGSENYHNLDDAVKEYFRKKLKYETDKSVSSTARSDEYLKELIELSDNNIWIEWFSKAIIKQGWIDFEAEISNVVQRVEEFLCTNVNTIYRRFCFY
ncbi:AbiH family protein [Ruminococcus albus]|nr:AbiH family protein [Ruminococcus albus]MCC3351597.1 bacteriophage abortive infection AbiH family protein [Ruminococcus albus 8]